MNIQNYTVNQARSIIRNNQDMTVVRQFLEHKDRRVRLTADHALRYKLVGVVMPAEKIEAVDPELQATAEKYGLSVSEVLALVSEKGSLLSVRRSLAARKAVASKKKMIKS